MEFPALFARVGRWTRTLKEKHPAAHLLLVGRLEEQDPLPENLWKELREDPRVRWVSWTEDVTSLYAIMDLVVLPSHREGFPNVPLEAAAFELPVVTTSIAGCVDAVVDCQTGLIVPPKQTSPLVSAVHHYLQNDPLRVSHGKAGRTRVLKEFRREQIWAAQAALYEELLLQKAV